MSRPNWLPAKASNFRETDLGCIWEEPSYRIKGEIRTVRRRKYLCLGGALNGQRLCTEQVQFEHPNAYKKFNGSQGSQKNSMVMIHISLLI